MEACFTDCAFHGGIVLRGGCALANCPVRTGHLDGISTMRTLAKILADNAPMIGLGIALGFFMGAIFWAWMLL